MQEALKQTILQKLQDGSVTRVTGVFSPQTPPPPRPWESIKRVFATACLLFTRPYSLGVLFFIIGMFWMLFPQTQSSGIVLCFCATLQIFGAFVVQIIHSFFRMRVLQKQAFAEQMGGLFELLALKFFQPCGCHEAVEETDAPQEETKQVQSLFQACLEILKQEKSVIERALLLQEHFQSIQAFFPSHPVGKNEPDFEKRTPEEKRGLAEAHFDFLEGLLSCPYTAPELKYCALSDTLDVMRALGFLPPQEGEDTENGGPVGGVPPTPAATFVVPPTPAPNETNLSC